MFDLFMYLDDAVPLTDVLITTDIASLNADPRLAFRSSQHCERKERPLTLSICKFGDIVYFIILLLYKNVEMKVQ